ncbi:WAS/WASL-interacting protein family member 3-like [Cimex lectularius]|uniref:Uncharacterized protein n=1 Tax=Cimex lectularius TaxID=79782 RepID=A0A8I6TM16_CIMLE|nr:WAS/WASL-interacting protein family member 3-like [Cimex lectularius]
MMKMKKKENNLGVKVATPPNPGPTSPTTPPPIPTPPPLPTPFSIPPKDLLSSTSQTHVPLSPANPSTPSPQPSTPSHTLENEGFVPVAGKRKEFPPTRQRVKQECTCVSFVTGTKKEKRSNSREEGKERKEKEIAKWCLVAVSRDHGNYSSR